MLAEGYSDKRIFGCGPVPCDVMLIGEAPGANEDKSGIPFYGQAGQNLNRALKEAGLSRNDVFVTNCVPFRPPKNRKPTQDEFMKVSNLLRDDLWTVKPRYIVLLGGTALSLLTDLEGIGKNRGWISAKNHVFDSVKTFATYHPAACLYDPTKKLDFAEDLKTFAKVILSDPNPELNTAP